MYTIPLVKKYHNKASELSSLLAKKTEKYWTKRGERASLRLFHAMAKRVPAYKDFLKRNGITNPSLIRTMRDFKKIPIANKENYLLHYPREQLCWNGKFSKHQWMISSTSGSTGKPFYFPRTTWQDRQYGLTAEICLQTYFDIKNKSTLFVNCFALGVWIGGMFVYEATKYILDSGKYPFSMITPGADKVEALKAVKNLAPNFNQVIIGGYGPLVKDLIDQGRAEGLDWNKYKMKYFFAAEGFTEGYRDYLKTHGGAQDIFGGTLNTYGTADLGSMAHETPVSILARRLALDNPTLRSKIFAYPHRLPTFAQYIPELYFFEEVEGRLLCSSAGGLPLVRYDLKDTGQVMSYKTLTQRLKTEGKNFKKEMSRRKIHHPVWNLPFVSVYERNDLTVSIYSINIYPECIKKALEKNQLQRFLTGKFTMMVDFDKEHNQFLQIHIELLPKIAPSKSLEKQALDAIITQLSRENSEWRDFYIQESIRHKVTPRLAFCNYQHPKHFKPGGKQKWVKKQK